MKHEEILNKLESGEIRAAKKVGDRWLANTEVKEAILQAFKTGVLVEENGFIDKHNLMPQKFSLDRGIRMVPGGTSVRRGAFIASGVILMPPAFVNVGAYVDEGTMIDSHVLVGSCAQIGKRVHLSAGVQIGGVLEPIGLAPVVIEDDCFVGADAIIVEGVQVLKGAIIAPGVVLSKALSIYDCVRGKVLPPGSAIPERAVVVSGSRPVSDKLVWGKEMGLQMYCPMIVKYRDEKSDKGLTLEECLR